MEETIREGFLLIVQWALFLFFGGIFAIVAAFNGSIAWRQWIKGVPEEPSIAPLIGGMLGGVAVLAAPFGTMPDRLPYLWVPAILDFGTLPYFLVVIFYLIKESMESRRRKPE